MELIYIPLVALLGSLLTFFSGFGLGTLLTPVFLLFFPVELAIALTAIVHFLNNIFKLVLVGKHIDWPIALRFGLPAIFFSFLGALCLDEIGDIQAIGTYEAFGKTHAIKWNNLFIGLVLIFFAFYELLPSLKNKKFGKDKLILGGVLSGFFGGFSGHQGGLRSAFLVNAGLSKEAFIATGVIIASLIDTTRLGKYFVSIPFEKIQEQAILLSVSCLAAFVGAYFGAKLLKKVTFKWLQTFVGFFLILMGLVLISGILER
jgi:uncharacterized membrane protein YfcA